jgi:hypothetical protein
MTAEPMKIILHTARVNPEGFVTFFRGWLTRYEAARRSASVDQTDDPSVIEINANKLAAAIAASVDDVVERLVAGSLDSVSKQAFCAGAGRYFPEVVTAPAAPGAAKSTATMEPRERIQYVERDPETLEITRTITK